MKFDEALEMMLFGGLVSYGSAAQFQIDDEVARFFAERAKNNIVKAGQPTVLQYAAGVRAIEAIPRFFDRVELQMNATRFPSLDGVDQLIKNIESARLGCIFPYCTDVP